MAKPKITYRSYLLRLWRRSEPEAHWQAMLESIPQDGSHQYFNDLVSLADFILNLQPEFSEKHKEE
jgi:hypothetical protein